MNLAIIGNTMQLFQLVYPIILSAVVWTIGDAEDGIASKDHSKNIQKKRCSYKLRRLWQTDISSFPFAASPLVIDINGDGGLDIVAAPFGESFAVIDGETGKHLPHSNWPQHNLDKSIHSSPLQYDIDGDGMLDVLFTTSQGELLFYSRTGQILHKFNAELNPAFVQKDWFKKTNAVHHKNIKDYVHTAQCAECVAVDAHVLSTPVLHNMRQLVIAVSYFFSDDDYDPSEIRGPWGAEDTKNKFYVIGLVIIDLEAYSASTASEDEESRDVQGFSKTLFLELWQSPTAFNLFSPTVINIKGDFGQAEILLAPSSPSGNLYVISMDGALTRTIALSLSPISSRISVANLDSDPSLELTVCSTNGTLLCIDAISGQTQWSVTVGGAVAGSHFADVDLDGQLDVIVATDTGNVYALNGETGAVLPEYPFKANKRIAGHVLVTKLNPLTGPLDLIFLSDDGLLNILASDQSCHLTMALGESTLVDIALYNIVLMNRGMEMLIATADGSLVCIGSGQETPVDEIVQLEYHLYRHRLRSPVDPMSQNDFTFVVQKPTIMIDQKTKLLKEVTGSSFDLYFTIHSSKAQPFKVNVYMGSQLVHTSDKVTSEDGTVHLTIQTPELPGQALVTVVMYDSYGFMDSDSLSLKFNQLILLDLQWLVLAPFIGMLVILLVNHGFPAKDLLPVTFPFKSK